MHTRPPRFYLWQAFHRSVFAFFLIAIGLPDVQAGAKKKDNSNDIVKPQPRMGLLREISISPDGARAVAGDSNNVIWVWDVCNRKVLRLVQTLGEAKSRSIPCYSFSRDGKYAVVGIQPGRDADPVRVDPESLTFWDLTAGVKLRALALRNEPVTMVALSPDGTRAASVSLWKTVWSDSSPNEKAGVPTFHYSLRLWDTVDGMLIRTLSTDYHGHISFSADSKFLINARKPSEANGWLPSQKWETKKGKEIPGTKGGRWGDDQIWCIRLSPDDNLLAIGGDAGVKVWNPKTGKTMWHESLRVERRIFHKGRDIGSWSVSSIAFSTDGARMAAAGAGGIVMIDVATGKTIPSFSPVNELADAVCFTHDNATLLSASMDGMRFRDGKSGKVLFTLGP